jgi:hypothetical protein
MSLLPTLMTALSTLSAQVDPNQGTMRSMSGAKQRLQDPTIYDAVFPFIAFFLVVVLPAAVAMWVIVRTLTEKSGEADEV